jgi:hypothetical protein
VVWEKPVSAAIERSDQCVAFGRRGAQSLLDHGRNLIVIDGSRPTRAGLVEQAQRSFKKRRRHLPTVCSCTPSSAATDLLGKPSAQRRTMRHRSDSDRATR